MDLGSHLLHNLTFDVAIFNPVRLPLRVPNPLQLLTGAVMSVGVDSVSHPFMTPGPVTTREFPPAKQPQYSKRILDDHEVDKSVCPVCLEDLCHGVCRLFCDHRLHHHCFWGILPINTRGADAMVRCPMCRATVDRDTLRLLGYDVSVTHLAVVGRACRDYRDLLHGSTSTLPQYHVSPSPERRMDLVRRILSCGRLEPADGLLYNVCVLPLDRMIADKHAFMASLSIQLATAPASIDPKELIDTATAVHVDVLLHTAHIALDME